MLLASSCLVHPQAPSPVRARAAPWWHGAAPPRQRAAAVQASEATNSGGDGDAEWVMRTDGANRGKLIPVRPGLAADLRPLAALAGMADAAALSRAVAALGLKREAGVVEHGTAVAHLLLSLGVQRPQLAALLFKCPLLFSWPPGERAAVLLNQLARLGLTAAEAARCFEQMPTAAGSPTFELAIGVLAPLFAAGSKADGSKSGERLLGDFLRGQPAAVGLLKQRTNTLQQRLSNLEQRYGPHWVREDKQAVIVAAMRRNDTLLARHPDRLLALEAALQQELGQQPGDGTRLLADILQYQAKAASCSEEKLRQRAQALAAEFGKQRLLEAPPSSLAEVLAVDTAVWQRALAVWRLLGVPDPAAVALSNVQSICVGWLAPGVHAKLAALQRLLPWRPTAADVVQQCAIYAARTAPERLIGRLLFLQQEGALPLLVADKRAAQWEWREEHGLPVGQPAGSEPQFVSLRDVARTTNAEFCALLATSGSQQESCGGQLGSSNGSVSERYEAFMAQLPQLPAYRQLLAAGAAESERLAAALPPELVAAAEGQRKLGRGAEEDGA